MGVQAAVGQGPRSTRATGSCPTAGVRDAAVQLRDPPRRRLPGPPGPGAHRVRSSSSPADEPPLSSWPGRPRRGRCRPTSPSPSAPTSTTPSCEERRRIATSSARPRVGAYERELADADRVGTVKGRELVGRSYAPLFPFFADQPNAFRVLAGDFVATEEGTGVVHIAPGFGEDDQTAVRGRRHPARRARSTTQGRFTAEVPDWAGVNVFDANPDIIRDLKDARPSSCATRPTTTTTRTAGAPTRRSSTGRCRPGTCRSPTFSDRMVELNQQINWVPEHVRDGSFGKWLENARDWSISRNRFWGSPIPVWKSDDPAYPRIDVYGSLDEIERDFGVRPDDLHRPAIDELARPNPDDPTGQSTMRRVPRCSTAGSSRARCRSPRCTTRSRTSEWFEHHFPGDFIVEYIGQTRGWFYTLHVLATALFDRPAVPARASATASCSTTTARSCRSGCATTPTRRDVRHVRRRRPALVPDVVAHPARRRPHRRPSSGHPRRGAPGAATRSGTPSTSSPSTPTPTATAAQFRTDQHRRARPLPPGQDRTTGRHGHRRAWTPTTSSAPAPRCASFLDALNNWYIRRSRDRFWDGDADAFDTLATTLHVLTRLAAPASCQKSRLITASTAFPTSNVRSASRQPSSCRLSPGRTSAVMAVEIGTSRQIDDPEKRSDIAAAIHRLLDKISRIPGNRRRRWHDQRRGA